MDVNRTLIKIVGHSMKPVLYENDLAVVEPVNTYYRGDIIVYRYGNDEQHIVHRIIFCEDNKIYICKGDNSFQIEKVQEENIIGKVIFIIRENKILLLPKVSEKFLLLSAAVNKEFIKNNSDLKSTITSNVYKKYNEERKELCLI